MPGLPFPGTPRLSRPLEEMSAAELLMLRGWFDDRGNRRAERIVTEELNRRRLIAC